MAVSDVLKGMGQVAQASAPSGGVRDVGRRGRTPGTPVPGPCEERGQEEREDAAQEQEQGHDAQHYDNFLFHQVRGMSPRCRIPRRGAKRITRTA